MQFLTLNAPWKLLPEFDKFLEERAKAAEMVSTLPTPPSDELPAAAGASVNASRKAGRSEDSVFAL